MLVFHVFEFVSQLLKGWSQVGVVFPILMSLCHTVTGKLTDLFVGLLFGTYLFINLRTKPFPSYSNSFKPFHFSESKNV